MNALFNHIRHTFAAQFEKDGDGFIYRYSQKGPAIRVSPAERDAFLKQFNRSVWLIIGVILATMLVMIGGLTFYVERLGREPPQIVIYLSVAAILAASLPISYRGWGAPARALKARTPVAQARSSEEYRRLYLGKLSYGQLAFVALFGCVVPFLASRRFDVFSGWNRVWFVSGGGLVILCAVQAARKWRIERRDR
jgi:hypothetical protein